jgi:hypothetical protein
LAKNEVLIWQEFFLGFIFVLFCSGLACWLVACKHFGGFNDMVFAHGFPSVVARDPFSLVKIKSTRHVQTASVTIRGPSLNPRKAIVGIKNLVLSHG